MNDRERLSRWIDDQGKTVEEIANELGTSRSYLSAVKGGSKDFGPGFCWRFRKVYGNDVADAIFVDELSKPVKDVGHVA